MVHFLPSRRFSAHKSQFGNSDRTWSVTGGRLVSELQRNQGTRRIDTLSRNIWLINRKRVKKIATVWQNVLGA